MNEQYWGVVATLVGAGVFSLTLSVLWVYLVLGRMSAKLLERFRR